VRDIGEITRVELGILPTPFHKLENVSKLTSRQVYIKRDDMTGVALGGNKIRKLEYLLADAIAQGHDTIITTGAAQSNHATLTAACCRKLGLDVHLVLMKQGVSEMKGNLLLDHLMRAEVTFIDSDSFDEVYAEIEHMAEELRTRGRSPYVIPVGASVPLGAIGYVKCVRELMLQAAAQKVRIDHIVCCAGSGGMHAGVALGATLFGNGTKVTGIAVAPKTEFPSLVCELANGAADILNSSARLTPADITMFDYSFPGYPIPSELGNAAIRLMAENEGIFLDPVYTGKTFAGLLDLCKKDHFRDDETIVFLHSGGAGSLFAIPIE
jgi:D-cysteine desulfhydrase family pyridoxal phosphate-dependent enzyme